MSHKSVLAAASVVVVAALVAMVAVLVGTAGPAEAAFPGKNGKIAYSTGGDIWTMKPDGSDQTRLTDATGGEGFGPQWSANGRKILFNFCSGPDPDYCTGEVRRMNADGSGEVTLTATHDWWPSWFPNRNRIVFTHWGGRPEGFGIYAMTFDASGEATRTTLLTNDGDCPVVSPDGTKIAFLSYRNGESMGLWVMGAAPEGPANQPVKIASGMPWGCGSNATHEWSPDGKRIAYTPQLSNPDGTTKPSDIWVMNADGTHKTNLTKTPDVSETSPAFSPDGEKMVFSHHRDGGRTGIWKMGADGSNPTRLTNDPGHALAPDWQPLP